jgi:hypothetical protein
VNHDAIREAHPQLDAPIHRSLNDPVDHTSGHNDISMVGYQGGLTHQSGRPGNYRGLRHRSVEMHDVVARNEARYMIGKGRHQNRST